jgi:DNA polymerase-1
VSAKVLLIDGHSLFHRAFHALPPLSTSDGRPTNAVYGFLQMALLLLEQQQPEYVMVALDAPGATFRDEMYEEYKAKRPPLDDALISQLPLLAKAVEALGLAAVQVEGYEADDVIGTAARQAAADGNEVVIVTGDKDLLQLVRPGVEVVTTVRGIKQTKTYDEAAVREEYDLEPAQIPDLKGLAGDSSDNIPGVPGIGQKTAASLLAQFGSVEAALDSLDAVDSERTADRLREHADTARLSKELASIRTDVPMEASLEQFRWAGPRRAELRELATDLEFTSLLDRLPGEEAAATQAAIEIIGDEAEMQQLIEAVRAEGCLCVAPVGEAGELAGLAVATGEGEASVVPLGGANGEEGTLFGGKARAGAGLSTLAELLADGKVGKRGADLKGLSRGLKGIGITLRGCEFDPEIASYLLAPHRRDHSIATLAQEHLGHALPDGETGLGEGISPAQARACAEAIATRQLYGPLHSELARAGLLELLEELEMPLVHVLADMEAAGIAVDLVRLEEVGEQLGGMMEQLEGKIHELAGCQFNIGSPQQLAQVLFERLELPKGRRTKTGWSTSAAILEQLAEEHEIARLVLEFREYSKLKSTYVDALARLVDRQTGRVHTTFEQTVAATGRLSSRNPNLQNIPIRTEWGREIRSCFVPGADDRVLIAADYSQIELRILAHLCGDRELVGAFQAGEDIHVRTASAVFSVEPEQVTRQMRSQAKTINYAVIYGMGATALAQQLGIERKEAARFIESYFERLAGVRKYTEDVVQLAREQGFVSTLMGRKRLIPDINSSDQRAAAYAERAAVNTPVQGSAADIIKLAMIRLAPRLAEASAYARMLLQVHDELVLEAPEDEAENVAALAKEVMEAAFELQVPLTVDVSVGRNWRDMQRLD